MEENEKQHIPTEREQQPAAPAIKPDLLDYDDICKMAPFFKGKPKLVKWLFHLLDIDDANRIHGHNCHTPGVPFCTGFMKDLNATITYSNGEVLDNLPEGPFITVSNHPFGAIDGVMMIHIIGTRRPDYKFMVNMLLSKIGGMMPNFITVDALASDDPEKRAVSMQGISETLKHVKASDGVLPRRCGEQAEPPPACRGPRVAAGDHASHPEAQGACDTHLYPRPQQLDLPCPGRHQLEAAHLAPARRDFPPQGLQFPRQRA